MHSNDIVAAILIATVRVAIVIIGRDNNVVTIIESCSVNGREDNDSGGNNVVMNV